MSEEDRDPYAPPRSEVEVSTVEERPWARKQPRVEKVLRRVGAGCVIFLMMVSLFRGASTDWMVKAAVVVVWALPVLAFLLGGKKSHLAVSLLMLVSVGANGYGVMRVLEFAKGGSVEVSLRLLGNAVMSGLACWGALGCAVALCVKGWRRA